MIEKSVSGPPIRTGEVTYTIHWQNNSAATAANDVVIADNLPREHGPGSGQHHGRWTHSGGAITWTSAASPPAGVSGTVSFQVTVNPGRGRRLQSRADPFDRAGTGSVTVASQTTAYSSLPWCDSAFNPNA